MDFSRFWVSVAVVRAKFARAWARLAAQPARWRAATARGWNKAAEQPVALGALAVRLWARVTAQPVLVLFAITLGVTAVLNPVKIGLLFWGLCKLACFGFAGAWVFDRLFRRYSPDEPGIIEGVLWKLKALIVAASIVAGALLP